MISESFNFRSLYQELGFKPVSVIFSVSSLIILAFGFWISISNGIELFFLAGILAIPFIFLLVKYPKYWLYMTAITAVFFFRSSDEGTTSADVLSGLFYIGGLYIWLFYQIIIIRRKLVKYFYDWIILCFYALLPLNLIIALFNNVEFLEWLKEYTLFSLILYYFPIRELMKETKDFRNLLVFFMFSTLILDFIQFYQYYKITFSDLTYAFQLSSSVRLNQPLFTSAGIFGILYSLHTKNKYLRVFLLFFSTLTMMALIASFSRAFWIMFIVTLVLIIFLIKREHRKKIYIYIASIVFIFGTLSIILFSDKVQFLYLVIERRMSSTAEGTKDLSIQMRLNEYEAAMNEVIRYPIGGSGLSKKFSFYDPIGIKKVDSNFIHNGYLFIIYRIGIPLSLLYFLFLLISLMKPVLILRRVEGDFWRMALIGSLTSILMMIVTNFITTTFFAREGSFIMAVSIAVFGILEEKNILKRNRND
jgi:hypothetical protein